MKKIHGSSALKCFKCENGIIIAYSEAAENGRAVIKYKKISFETGKASFISKNDFLYYRFGQNFTSFDMQLPRHLTWKTVLLPDSNILAVGRDGGAKMLNYDATTVWQGTMGYKGQGPSDIALHKNTLWASFSEGNALIRYNLDSKREELRIGGGENSAFVNPGGIYITENTMTVCNTGKNELLKVNLETYEVFKYAEFGEPVYQYLTIGQAEFILLESGLYVM